MDVTETELSSNDLEAIAIVYDKIRQVFKHLVISQLRESQDQAQDLKALEYLAMKQEQ